jgi:hypothetical protein
VPIDSFTGLPGNGKTALMVEDLIEQSKKGERPIFAAGIDGLAPGLATVLPDPVKWNAVKPGERCTCHDTEDSQACDAHVVPNGALIYVDEAWKWFGHLHNATHQKTPEHVLQLAEHRHRGIDFKWTFQQPNQIYPFARGLMAEHHHVVRRFGTKFIDVFTWSELNEDVKSAAKREAAQRKTRMLPSHVFDQYKSAEVHTIKRRIPLKVLALPLIAVVAVVLAFLAVDALRPENMTASLGVKSEQSQPNSKSGEPGDAPAGGDSDAKPPRYKNAFEYAQAHLPRLGMMPWTAPIYDERGVTADPQLYCMSSREGQVDDGEWKGYTCTCLTEQGTAYQLSAGECRNMARYGPPHNPYKERREDQVEHASPVVASPGLVASTPGAVIDRPAALVGNEGKDLTPEVAP